MEKKNGGRRRASCSSGSFRCISIRRLPLLLSSGDQIPKDWSGEVIDPPLSDTARLSKRCTVRGLEDHKELKRGRYVGDEVEDGKYVDDGKQRVASRRLVAYLWESGRDPEFSTIYGRMCLEGLRLVAIR